MRRLAIALAGVVMTGAGAAEARPLRVMALDQCADQYALALSPDADLALSPRADDPDAWLRTAAAGRRRMRPTLEAAIAFRPDVVVRYWGGEPRLLARLEATGVRVVTIEDATAFEPIFAPLPQPSAFPAAARPWRRGWTPPFRGRPRPARNPRNGRPCI